MRRKKINVFFVCFTDDVVDSSSADKRPSMSPRWRSNGIIIQLAQNVPSRKCIIKYLGFMIDMTIFQTDKGSYHFVKRNTFQHQLCDGESGSLVRLYLQCGKSNAYHWYAFDSLTYRLKWYYHHTTQRMCNRWFCVWVTQMLLYSEIKLKLIWKLWKWLHAVLRLR